MVRVSKLTIGANINHIFIHTPQTDYGFSNCFDRSCFDITNNFISVKYTRYYISI